MDDERVAMAHSFNPNYLGVRNQEDHDSRPAQAKSSPDPIWKICNTKQGWQSGSSGRASV
jgi:hypothetical protein